MGPQASRGEASELAVRLAVRIVAVVALLAGAVFFFQGIGVIPGSFMTGRNEWAVIGAALVAGAGALLWLVGMAPGGRSDR
jgi:protein-S-isoprenylcysteine O-methyltransferase Ste14